MTKKASLPGRRVSLFALAEALCARKVKIDLLSRGSEFEGKYTALWPDVSEVSRETEEVFNSLIENHENAMTELVNIAEEVRELFLSMTEDKKEAGLSSADEDEEKVTEQQENGESSAEHTQIKLEFDSEEKALEDVEKEKMRSDRKSWKRNSVNYRRQKNFRHFWKVRKNRGIPCGSSVIRSAWHSRIPAMVN